MFFNKSDLVFELERDEILSHFLCKSHKKFTIYVEEEEEEEEEQKHPPFREDILYVVFDYILEAFAADNGLDSVLRYRYDCGAWDAVIVTRH